MRPTLRRLAEQQIQIETLGAAVDLIASRTGVDITAAKTAGTARTRAFSAQSAKIPDGTVTAEDRAAFRAVASTRRKRTATHKRATHKLGASTAEIFGFSSIQSLDADPDAFLAEFNKAMLGRGIDPLRPSDALDASRDLFLDGAAQALDAGWAIKNETLYIWSRQAGPTARREFDLDERDGLYLASRIRRRADVDNPANPNPEPSAQAPAVSQDEAESVQDTADVESAYGESATENVPADATIDLFSDQVVGDIDLDPNKDDPTVPVAGTTSNDGNNRVEPQIEGDPGSPHDDDPAFPLSDEFATAASKAQARTFAALRLARLRIEAGIEPRQDDLALGQTIAASRMTNREMAVEIKALDGATTASKRKAKRQPRPITSHASDTRSMPSMISGPASNAIGSVPSMGVTDDEVLW